MGHWTKAIWGEGMVEQGLSFHCGQKTDREGPRTSHTSPWKTTYNLLSLPFPTMPSYYESIKGINPLIRSERTRANQFPVIGLTNWRPSLQHLSLCGQFISKPYHSLLPSKSVQSIIHGVFRAFSWVPRGWCGKPWRSVFFFKRKQWCLVTHMTLCVCVYVCHVCLCKHMLEMTDCYFPLSTTEFPNGGRDARWTDVGDSGHSCYVLSLFSFCLCSCVSLLCQTTSSSV